MDNIPAQIEQAKQEWEATVDSLPQFVCLVDKEGKIIRANRTVERWGLAQVVNVKGRDLHQLLHRDCDDDDCYLTKFLDEAWDKLSQGQATECEAEDTNLRRYLSLQLRPTVVGAFANKKESNGKNKITGSFASVVISDITERKRMEEALRRANEELEERVENRTAALKQAVSALKEEVAERKRAEEALRESEHRQRQRAAELHALHKTSLRLNAQLEITELLNLIAEQVVSLLGADAGGLYIYDTSQEHLYLSVAVGYFNKHVGTTLGVGEGLVGKAFEQRRHMAYSTWAGEVDDYHNESQLRAALAVPLLGTSGILGVLSIGSENKKSFNEHDQWLAELFAAQAAIALENAHLHTEAQNHAKKLTALNKASHAVVSALDLDTVLNQIIVEIRTLFEAEGASVLLLDDNDEELIFSAVANPEANMLVGKALSIESSIAGWVVREKESVVVNDVQDDTRFFDGIDHITGLHTHSLLATPIIVKDEVIGVVEVMNKASGNFEKSELEILESLSGSAAIAIENARLYEAERKQFLRLQQSQAQLVQIEKMAALGRLVASIAHEINNPLQSIQGFLNLVDEELKGRNRADKLDFYLHIAGSEIERISDIVRRMRDFYRPTEQGQQPSPDSMGAFYRSAPMQNIHIDEVLDTVLQLAYKKLQHNMIDVKQDWEDDLPVIQGNPDYLKQVFLNLSLNAVDAMSDKGGTLYVRVKAKEARLNTPHPIPVIQIEFQDTGTGMPPEVLSRLFEPLFTTKQHGTGFGLFTSYQIIEAHNGQIHVDSEEMKGTTFTILLPI